MFFFVRVNIIVSQHRTDPERANSQQLTKPVQHSKLIKIESLVAQRSWYKLTEISNAFFIIALPTKCFPRNQKRHFTRIVCMHCVHHHQHHPTWRMNIELVWIVRWAPVAPVVTNATRTCDTKRIILIEFCRVLSRMLQKVIPCWHSLVLSLCRWIYTLCNYISLCWCDKLLPSLLLLLLLIEVLSFLSLLFSKFHGKLYSHRIINSVE